ncbi:hypothetical protein [Qipengyuania gaetbuli]|uniref:hypothetical protein n=1 Tax=Qipengyuania gaetbuli TaxID=266952 RepID=UPI001CD4EA25|nr:hypothetical protein [Qipengyuania gaetbuli]MCA0910044.1 hypothetical protein [Qipengyuania gaetbuli]
MTVDRRLRQDARPAGAMALLWLVVASLLTIIAWPYLGRLLFPDPDDVLRLLQVRDLLAGQSWFDVTQHRIAPPDGVPMHWSRIVDVPLALLILALTPLIGEAQAEVAAAIIVPLCLLFITLQVIGRLAWRLFDRQTAILACVVVALWPLLLVEMQPLRIDHHAWQIMVVAIALWALSWRTARRGGAIAGMAMGVGATISLEVLPMAAVFALVLFLRWAIDYRQRIWLVTYMQALAATIALLFALTKGPVALTSPVYCDAISAPHVGFFAVAALGTSLIARLQRLTLPVLVILFAVVAAAGLAVIALTGRQCLASPFASLDPIVMDLWYANVREGVPIWRQDADVAIGKSLQMLVALGASIALVLRSRDWLRLWWIEYTVILLAAVAAAALTHRSFYYVGIVGAVPIGWLASSLLQRVLGSGALSGRLVAALGLYLALMPAAPVALAKALLPQTAVPDPSSSDGRASVNLRESRCGPAVQPDPFPTLEPGIVLTHFDVGPYFLLNTPHSVVATGHHRANAAMRDVLDAFTGSPEDALAIMERRPVDYIAICPELAEAGNLARYGGDTSLIARLIAGDALDWLEEIPSTAPTAIRVWRVRPDGNPLQSR